METLIELFDRRPLENILGAEMFRPRRIVYICPEFVARDAALHRRMRLLFRRRGLQAELIFFKADMYNADAVLALLRSILERYPDCAMDITGGTDDVLFAAGLLSAETSIPVFTYSRRKNCFSTSATRTSPTAGPAPCSTGSRISSSWPAAPCATAG